MSPTLIGFLGILLMLLLLVASLPVAFAMGIVGVIGFAAIIRVPSALAMLATNLYGSLTDYNLTVIPMFVFMGQVCFHAGISRRLFNAAYHWMGWLPGGLAMATVGACAAFGAICGSGPATAATMSAVALPEMRRFNYSDALASGVVASGGGLGMLIPPSVVFIVYGVLTEQSIGKLFIAGILPGLLVALLFCLVVLVQCLRDPRRGPAGPRFPLRERLDSLKGVAETLALFALVMGGMFAGWFTPTEGAAIGAAGSLGVAAIVGKCSLRMIWRAAQETIRTSCMVMIIIAGATIFSRFLAVTELPNTLAAWLAALPLPTWMVLGLIMVFYLIAGCFVDALALIMLTVPIFYPVVLQLGYEPIWFGVMIVLVTMIGAITPPVGVNVYVVSGMERNLPLQTVFRGSMPFLGALIAAAILLMLIPGLATWLPGLVQ